MDEKDPPRHPANAEQCEAILADGIRAGKWTIDQRDVMATLVGLLRGEEQLATEWDRLNAELRERGLPEVPDRDVTLEDAERTEAKLREHGLDWDDLYPNGRDRPPDVALMIKCGILRNPSGED